MMRLTIGGPPGSGTTSIARMLSSDHGLIHIYAGMIFREMAKERGLSLAEFSRLAESDESFDRSVDERMAKLAIADKDSIAEGRMAAFVVEDPDIRIWLDAPFNVRVARIAEREGLTEEIVKAMTIDRQKSETQRYQRYYGVDIYDLSNYDIVINTEKWNVQGVYRILDSAITNLVRATQD
ncbi:MAG TPA: AAA family ATPase [Candidatus Methanofastidiosa archaeon]|nr:AAA family ATPase [Candidatus Methanofastidiosa archaeon]